MTNLTLTSYAETEVLAASSILLLTKAKSKVASQSSAFCSVEETQSWFPLPPGTTLQTLTPPTIIVNSSPIPANSVELPPDFDDTDLCYIFQDLLSVSNPPVYAEEINPVYILAPYSTNYSLTGVTRTSISVREYPYELTLPGASIAAVTYARITYNIVVPSVDVQFAGAAPVITQSINARVSAAADVVIGSDAPVVGQLIGIYIEAPAPPLIAIEALTPVVTPSTQLRPAAADVAQAADTVSVPGSVQIRPAAAGIAQAGIAPEVGRIIGINVQPSSAAIEVAAPVPTAP